MADEVKDSGELSLWDLQSGFQTTPLRKVKGDLVEISENENHFIAFKLANLEVLESIEPYDLATAAIDVGRKSNKADSKWGVMAISIRPFVAPGTKPENLIGHRIGLVMTPDHPLPSKSQETGKWETKKQDAWEMFEFDGKVQGGVAKSAEEIAVDLLDGKTAAQFKVEAAKNDLIRTDPALIKSIADNSFAAKMVTAGKFELKDGKYSKK